MAQESTSPATPPIEAPADGSTEALEWLVLCLRDGFPPTGKVVPTQVLDHISVPCQPFSSPPHGKGQIEYEPRSMAISRDGCYAAVGTKSGQLAIFERSSDCSPSTWHPAGVQDSNSALAQPRSAIRFCHFTNENELVFGNGLGKVMLARWHKNGWAIRGSESKSSPKSDASDPKSTEVATNWYDRVREFYPLNGFDNADAIALAVTELRDVHCLVRTRSNDEAQPQGYSWKKVQISFLDAAPPHVVAVSGGWLATEDGRICPFSLRAPKAGSGDASDCWQLAIDEARSIQISLPRDDCRVNELLCSDVVQPSTHTVFAVRSGSYLAMFPDPTPSPADQPSKGTGASQPIEVNPRWIRAPGSRTLAYIPPLAPPSSGSKSEGHVVRHWLLVSTSKHGVLSIPFHETEDRAPFVCARQPRAKRHESRAADVLTLEVHPVHSGASGTPQPLCLFEATRDHRFHITPILDYSKILDALRVLLGASELPNPSHFGPLNWLRVTALMAKSFHIKDLSTLLVPFRSEITYRRRTDAAEIPLEGLIPAEWAEHEGDPADRLPEWRKYISPEDLRSLATRFHRVCHLLSEQEGSDGGEVGPSCKDPTDFFDQARLWSLRLLRRAAEFRERYPDLYLDISGIVVSALRRAARCDKLPDAGSAKKSDQHVRLKLIQLASIVEKYGVLGDTFRDKEERLLELVSWNARSQRGLDTLVYATRLMRNRVDIRWQSRVESPERAAEVAKIVVSPVIPGRALEQEQEQEQVIAIVDASGHFEIRGSDGRLIGRRPRSGNDPDRSIRGAAISPRVHFPTGGKDSGKPTEGWLLALAKSECNATRFGGQGNPATAVVEIWKVPAPPDTAKPSPGATQPAEHSAQPELVCSSEAKIDTDSFFPYALAWTLPKTEEATDLHLLMGTRFGDQVASLYFGAIRLDKANNKLSMVIGWASCTPIFQTGPARS